MWLRKTLDAYFAWLNRSNLHFLLFTPHSNNNNDDNNNNNNNNNNDDNNNNNNNDNENGNEK